MDLVAYWGALALMWLFALLPLGWALAIGRGLGGLLFSALRVRRATVLANLRHVYGGARSEAERLEMARACYRHFGMTAVEIARMSVKGLLASGALFAIEEEFAEALRRGFRERSGMVIAVPHLGNFDLAASASIQGLGVEVQVVMKPPHSPRFARLIADSRARNGMSLHFATPSSPIYGRLLSLVKEGHLLAALPDQNAKAKGVEVRFLGRPARIFGGLARLRLETGAPLYVGGAIRSREDPRRHTVVGFPVEAPPPSGDRERDVAATMQAIADGLTRLVERAPEQYFWFHHLWGKSLDSARSAGSARDERALRPDGLGAA